MGLLQTTTSPVIWQDCLLDSEAHVIWSKLETRFRKAGGGAVTYLQLVNMVNIWFTNSMDLLPQIQEFQDRYSKVTLNGHSKLSEDLATFMFPSHLPQSYEATTHQYLDNITDIANYKLSDIIARVLQEESRRKAHSIKSGSSLNKFSTVKNLHQKCAKCGKTNHSTQNHWPGGKIQTRERENLLPKKCQVPQGTKRKNHIKGRGKERGQKRCQRVPMYLI